MFLFTASILYKAIRAFVFMVPFSCSPFSRSVSSYASPSCGLPPTSVYCLACRTSSSCLISLPCVSCAGPAFIKP
ncbi:hypothetical protein BJV78DRAFT_189516 [Lactifluus subvellereus]|nr:hypothetical protein BJV78DRAFT_189516 [Lactifluus subvellereus]